MPKPRVRIPAQARERIYRAAAQFARSCADTMISNLENQLSAELHAAMRQPGAMPSGVPHGRVERDQPGMQQPRKVAYLTGGQVTHDLVDGQGFHAPLDHAR